MKRYLLLIVSIALFAFTGFAQQENPWKVRTDRQGLIAEKSVSRKTFPSEFKLFTLELPVLRRQLFTIVGNRQKHTLTIVLPNAEGTFEEFEVVEASNFDAELQAKFPEIRAFSGRGITDKYASLKLSISPQGIQTMVMRTGREFEFIEPYTQDHKVYSVFKAYRQPGQLPWTCSTPEEKLSQNINNQINHSGIMARSGGDLKTLRLAQSVTAEYSNYFGATSSSQVSLVLAAVNNTMTRTNGVYEKDLALHLNLVASSTNVFYYNASTDPYSAGSTGAGGAWSNELQNTLTSVIGEANYDIGHLFGASGGGGNAGCIGCICVNGSKGRGYTSPADGIPMGDKFDIDYVAHEIGHQLGANHTFSHSNEGTGQNKEPGSGITIMSYAGITNQDLAPNSLPFFHQTSIAQIQANLLTKTCPVTTSIAATNATPVLSTVSNFTIPISTPFALTGVATDANSSDVLTYSWEQNDNASSTQTGASSVASATKATGPNWIPVLPSTSPVRLFPRLSTILAGGLVSGPLTGGDAGANTEALSSVSRTLNFRLTVRDNAPYSSTSPVSVGQTQFTDMVVTVTNTSGPFNVTAPNTAVSWTGGTTQTITWNVANTTATPVSCANVKISLSTDGGQTFPTVLASTTPNDGSHAVVIPNTPTTTARIKIEAVGNIFFDISNANFTITAGSSCPTPTGLTSSAVTTNGATVSWAAATGAVSYAVDYKLNSSATWLSAATAATATSLNLSGLNAGSLYDWRVRANCSSGSGSFATAQFTTQVVCVAPTGLNATPSSTSATVNWTAVNGAVSYAVDYKLNTDINWTSLSIAQTSTSATISGLSASTLYDWRVSATCPSGTTTATAAQFTTTATPVCNAPTGLTAGSITASGAVVSWTAVSGAVNYAVDYKLNSSATWIVATASTTSTSVTLSGLTAASLYDYRVRTNCGTNGTSSFASAQFTTATAPTCVTAFEPNETLATAATIVSGATNSAAISSSTDIDFFKITTTVTSNISYVLTGPTGVDFDLNIYNSAGTQVGEGISSTANETVSLTNQAAGTYYIRVIGYNGASSSSCYTITATATPSSCRSALDNTTNNTTSGAATIPFNTNVTGQIESGGDVDHYRFVITTGGSITLTLTTLPANYHLRLVNNAGTILATSSKSGTQNESITSTVAAGTYFARVYGANTSTFNATSCYTVRVQLGTAARNEIITSTVADGSGVVVAYPNPFKNKLNITLNGYNGSTEVGIYTISGMMLKSARTSEGVLQMDLTDLPKGLYLMKVMNREKQTVISKIVKQ